MDLLEHLLRRLDHRHVPLIEDLIDPPLHALARVIEHSVTELSLQLEVLCLALHEACALLLGAALKHLVFFRVRLL